MVSVVAPVAVLAVVWASARPAVGLVRVWPRTVAGALRVAAPGAGACLVRAMWAEGGFCGGVAASELVGRLPRYVRSAIRYAAGVAAPPRWVRELVCRELRPGGGRRAPWRGGRLWGASYRASVRAKGKVLSMFALRRQSAGSSVGLNDPHCMASCALHICGEDAERRAGLRRPPSELPPPQDGVEALGDDPWFADPQALASTRAPWLSSRKRDSRGVLRGAAEVVSMCPVTSLQRRAAQRRLSQRSSHVASAPERCSEGAGAS